MIKIEDVSFRYKNSENVLENINLEINEGEFISIVGKNGTGKSTILNLLAGLTKPTRFYKFKKEGWNSFSESR